MQVVVTGATGHVGANLVRMLLDRGDEVRVLIHQDALGLDGLDVEIHTGDVIQDDLSDLMSGAEVLYHLAAVISIDGDPTGAVEATNVVGPRRAAEAALAAGVRRMVHCSSIHAFAEEPVDVVVDEARPRDPDAPCAYNRSKARGEAAVREVVARGLDAVVVHPTGIIGPYDLRPSRMGQVLLDLYHRRLPATVAGGFNWVDVRDVCQGIIAAGERGRTGESYLLGGAYLPVSELAQLASELTGVPAPRLDLPRWVAVVGLPFIRAWCSLTGLAPLYTSESLRALEVYAQVDTSKAARELGYSPRPIRQTVEDTYAWFEANGRLAAPGAGGAA